VLTENSPLHSRIFGYLGERFPPVAYTVLVGLFFGSGILVSQSLSQASGHPSSWLGSVVVWLVFFHLRVFDEHKDISTDMQAYPDRLLSRGIVTLGLLRRLAIGAVVLQVVLSAFIGMQALAFWGVAMVFTLLMRVEFGVGKWLQKRLVLYAITHNPIVALLALYIWACSQTPWDIRFLVYVAAISLGSLAFEFGRKINVDEVEGVDSYSSVLGRPRAIQMLVGTMFLAAIASASLIFLLLDHPWAPVGLALLGVFWVGCTAFVIRGRGIEASASCFLLGSMMAIGVSAWSAQMLS